MKANSMKTTLSLLLLTTAACGQVVDDADPAGPADDQVALDEAPPLDQGEPPTIAQPTPVISTEAPRAAGTQYSLFSMSLAANSPISSLVSPVENERIDVVQQRFTTTSSDPIDLVVEVAPVTGTYYRAIVSGTSQQGAWIEEYVPCPTPMADPRCRLTAPTRVDVEESGVVTSSKWRVRVFDAETGDLVTSCTDSSANQLACQLPGREGASYRIVASAWGFEELWNGNDVDEHSYGSQSFTGTWLPQLEHQCFETAYLNGALYCFRRYQYFRFQALDQVRLDLDPVAITIRANGVTSTEMSPGLIWDGGNDAVLGLF